MAQVSKVKAQIEIKSSCDKFYGFFRNNLKGLVNIFPQRISSVELTEGVEGSAGAVYSINYVIGSPMSIKARVDVVDDANKMLTFVAIDGDVTKVYKSFKAKLEVNEGGDATTRVECCFDYEKSFERAPDADPYANFAALICKGLDAYILSN